MLFTSTCTKLNLDVLRLAVGRADGIGEGRRRKHSKAQDDSRERPYQRVHKQQCPNKTCNAEACLIMYMKCKQVPSKAMQLQVHPGSVTKAQDVKGLGWLTPSRQGGSLHRASLCKNKTSAH